MSRASIELKLRDKLDKHVARRAQQGRNYAAELCPVDSGRLRQSLTVEKRGDAFYAYGTNVDYAIYPEFGTRYQAAQPYMRPSAERLRAAV